MNTIKENIYRLITSQDQKEIIDIIIDNTTDELKARLDIPVIPKTLEYIIHAVSIKRYNRLNNEGMSSISKDNVAIAYQENDFLEFQDVIKDFKKNHISKKSWSFL